MLDFRTHYQDCFPRLTRLIGVALSLLLAYGGQAVLLNTSGDNPREGLLQALGGGIQIPNDGAN